MKNFTLAVLALIFATGCVTRKPMPTVEVHDHQLTCAELQAEINRAGGVVDNRQDESGITGKNIGAALLFWPGIIVNEVVANKNIGDAQERQNHLTNLYLKKCTGDT